MQSYLTLPSSIIFLSSLVFGTVTWLLFYKIEEVLSKLLGSNFPSLQGVRARDIWRIKVPFWRNFLPTMVAMLPTVLFVVPVFFQGYIKRWMDWRVAMNIWSIGFWFGGIILARIIRKMMF